MRLSTRSPARVLAAFMLLGSLISQTPQQMLALFQLPTTTVPFVPRAAIGSRSQHSREFGRAARLATMAAQSTQSDTSDADTYDVIIIGSGPASLSLAALLTSALETAPKVAVVSKRADERWVPNYGSWAAEWATLDELYKSRGIPGLMQYGVGASWNDTECFFGEDETGEPSTPEGNERRSLHRPYVRLSREGLKSLFYSEEGRQYEVIKANVQASVVNTNIFMPVSAVTLGPQTTELVLDNGKKVRGKIVVDGTGAESSFTIRADREKEGYQIAYGVECKVKGKGVTAARVGDYDRKKMTLFDYRSDAWRDTENIDSKKVLKEPTFNYVMPLTEDVIFFEETSLVARPAMSFTECKNRLIARLASQGVEITDVLEEEFCYIPMGGAVPRRGQRIVPVGAAAGIVHASTGYQICRCLSSNLDVCDQILEELKANEGSFDPDVAAARIIGRTWTPAAIRQRNFALFGGDFLMSQNVEGLKGFFSGFFKLDEATWAGFLAGWKNLPNNELHEDWWSRLVFGVKFLLKLPFRTAADMTRSIIGYTLSEGLDLIQSVTPLVGEPQPFEDSFKFRANNGDFAAKEEAMEMMKADTAAKG